MLFVDIPSEEDGSLTRSLRSGKSLRGDLFRSLSRLRLLFLLLERRFLLLERRLLSWLRERRRRGLSFEALFASIFCSSFRFSSINLAFSASSSKMSRYEFEKHLISHQLFLSQFFEALHRSNAA